MTRVQTGEERVTIGALQHCRVESPQHNTTAEQKGGVGLLTAQQSSPVPFDLLFTAVTRRQHEKEVEQEGVLLRHVLQAPIKHGTHRLLLQIHAQREE